MTTLTGDRRPSRFDFDGPIIHTGTGCIEALTAELDNADLDRALIVTGRSVGDNDATMDPVVRALGDTHVDTFADTTPDKRLSTAYRVTERATSVEADVLVAVGGGSSIDTATVASALWSTDHDLESAVAALEADGTIGLGDDDVLPMVAVPTTLAGADISFGAGVTAHPSTEPVDEPASGGISHPRLMPHATFADPTIVATTPPSVLRGSAMNGFDKGIEAIYAPTATPVTDATAMRGLDLLVTSLPVLASDDLNPAGLAPIVTGTVLVQYGSARPDARSLSIIHAFGHGLTAVSDIQQGVAHAIMAPVVLRHLFAHVDGRRGELARALGVDTPDAHPDQQAESIVAEIEALVETLGVPTKLRAIDSLDEGDIPLAARITAYDGLMENLPAGYAPDEGDLRELLQRAW